MRALSRSLVMGFLAGFVLSASVSCGPSQPAGKVCGPGTCDGCCTDTGDCLAGTTVFECGAGGSACVPCEANQACNAGTCARFLGGDYDASFPDAPDASVNLDAGTYRPPDAGMMTVDAGALDAGPAIVSYANQVQPIFDAKCDACHQFTSASVMNNSRIVPNNLAASTIYQRTLSGDMPRGAAPLTTTQQNLLRDWILNGAPRN